MLSVRRNLGLLLLILDVFDVPVIIIHQTTTIAKTESIHTGILLHIHSLFSKKG